MGEYKRFDKPWGTDKINILVNGEADIGEPTFLTGETAYEQRTRAETSGCDDFPEAICEPTQLERAIRRGIQRDHEVRQAMLLRVRYGLDEFAIEQLLQSKRKGYHLLERGVELVRRHERGEYTRFKRANDPVEPVCWRCMKKPVDEPGQECGCAARPKGTGGQYDPTKQRPAAQLTDVERQAELEHLIETQQDAPIVGGENYRKHVRLFGDFDDRDTVKEAAEWDREWADDTKLMDDVKWGPVKTYQLPPNSSE